MTTVYLGRVLEDYLELPELARRAREGHFDDYFCPREVVAADGYANIGRLVYSLNDMANNTEDEARVNKIDRVIVAAVMGDFDGTLEEAERWCASKEGQAAFQKMAEEEM